MAKDGDIRDLDPGLDDLDFNQDVGSHEGISNDQIARARLAFLLGQNSSLITQMQFADAKAGALLAFIGLVGTRGPGAVVDIAEVTPMIAGQVLLHALALIAGIVVLFPRYAGHDVRRKMAREDRFSWPSLASKDYPIGAFAGFMRTAEISQMIISIARSNHTLSGILLKKYSWLRAAFAIAVLDVFFMALRITLSGALWA